MNTSNATRREMLQLAGQGMAAAAFSAATGNVLAQEPAARQPAAQSTSGKISFSLIIDDGLPGRKHRANIFNPNFNFAGAAFGPHARFGVMCNMDFAGGYAERGEAAADTLVARNF